MAASMSEWGRIFRRTRCVLNLLYRTLYLRGPSNDLCQKRLLFAFHNKFCRCLVFSAVAFTTKPKAEPLSDSVSSLTRLRTANEENAGKQNTGEMNFEPNDPRLRSHECLKNAAGLSVDSTSAVLSQTVYAMTKIEKEYVELVNVLIVLMEYQLQVLGHTAEENRIADLIVETRHEVSKVRQRKEDLNLLFGSVEKLADATAEVAFAVGAEYASTSTGERLHSAQQEVKRLQAELEDAEKRLYEAQAKSIEVLSQHEEKEQERALKEQELEYARDNQETESVPDGASSFSKEQQSDDFGSNEASSEDKEWT